MMPRPSPAQPLLAALTLLAALAFALPGCGDDEEPTPAAPVEDGPPQGIRLVYASAAGDPIDLLLINDAGDQVRVEGVAHGSASTYAALTPGMWRASVLEAGSNTSRNISLPPIDVSAEDAISLAIGVGDDGAERPLLLDDALVAPGENMSRLRVVCLLVGPDIDLFDDEADNRWTEGLTFGQLEPYKEVAAGRRDLQVQLQTGELLLSVPQLPLRPAENSTLWLIGDADPNNDGDFSDATLDFIHTVEHTF